MGIFGKSKKKVKKQQEKTAEKSTGTVDAGLTSKNKVPMAKEAREGPPKATRYYADSKERTSSKKSQPDGATTPTRNSSKKGKGSSEAPRAAPPPSAREAAFAGPPRFDWIDVVSEVPCRAVPYHTRDWRWNVILDSKLLAFEILTFFSSWKSIVCLFGWLVGLGCRRRMPPQRFSRSFAESKSWTRWRRKASLPRRSATDAGVARRQSAKPIKATR